MGNAEVLARHDAAVRRVAADLERRGYRVDVEPSVEHLPEFLANLRPDIIARRGDESLVVEVKLPTSAKKNMPAYVQALEGRPGWTFHMVIADEADLLLPPDESKIRAALDEPTDLLGGGHGVASILLAWTLLEAAARRRLAQDGEAPWRPRASDALLQRLVELGYLEQDDFPPLRRLYELRNRAAHGDLEVEVDAASLARLRAATEALLARREAA